jgi:hypothetical protein
MDKHRFNQLLESTMGNVKPLLNEVTNRNSAEKITNLKNEIDRVLDYYEVRDDGKIYDKSLNTLVSPETFKKLGPYYKTKIESILVGAKEDGQDLNTINSIKNEITSGRFKDFIGDYNNINMALQQINDYYTGIRCEYFKKGQDRQGVKLDITNRPWCK